MTAPEPNQHAPRVRVVINALHAKTGGGITYLRNMLPRMAADPRIELHIFLHRDQMDLFHPLDERVIVHLFSFPKGLVSVMVWEQVVLPVMLRVMSADVVFSPANFGVLAVRSQAILLRNALAVAWTETRLIKRAYWAALAVITLASIVRVRRAIAVSDYAARSLSLFLWPLVRSKARVIHHGVDEVFREAGDDQRDDYLLAVSDIYIQKNFQSLLKAMRIVCDRRPGTRLSIAGHTVDPWYYESVIALARKLGIQDDITFLGRLGVDELKIEYRRCRALVFPSTAETFGFPLVEAMACGTPIASSSSTAMPEIVGDAALLFDPLDVEAMAEAILRVMEDEELRADLRIKALKRSQDFSWDITARRTVDVLLEAAGQRGAA